MPRWHPVVDVGDWRKARAFLWIGITVGLLLILFLISGVVQIPGIPHPGVDLVALGPWVYVLPILAATKALLEVLRPLFRMALRTHVRYEADIFAHFQIVSYVVWATAIGLVFWILFGAGGNQQFGFLGTAVVSAAFLFVLQEPLLNFLGWIVLVSMRLYKLGDRIEMNNTRGYVVEITPLNTTIREFGGAMYGDSFTGRHVTIPNSQVLKANVFNYTKDTPFVWDQLIVSITYESDHKLAEKILLEAAEDVVGPLMRENRARLRSKYEFADLADYMAEEPRVNWTLAASSVEFILIYFCPVFAKASYKTRLVKRVIDMVMTEPRVQFAYPHVQFVPSAAEREQKEKEAKASKDAKDKDLKEKLQVVR